MFSLPALSLPGLKYAPSEVLLASLGLLLVINLGLLAAERHRLSIRLIAVQGILLGFMPLLALPHSIDFFLLATTAVFVGIKGLILPYLLRRTYKRLPPQPSMQPYLGNTGCVVLGLCGYGFSLWLGTQIGLAANPLFSLLFPVAFATIVTGLLLIATRRKALTQVFGYLVMENGIYLLGIPMAQTAALWLELSILLDLLVGVFVMAIAIHHIYTVFDTIDVDQFASLRD